MFSGPKHLNAVRLLAFVFWLSAVACGKKQRGQRPHVVFVLADDFGFNDIGYHAREHYSDMYTPFLDSLAAKGVILENYYVQPICSPTRGQLLTGRYQIHTGLAHGIIRAAQPYGLPLDNILLSQQLRQCGYKTNMVGKWHLGFFREEYLPWNRGFQNFFGFLNGGVNHFTRYHCEPKKTRRFCGYDMIDSRYGPTNATYGEYSTNLFIRKSKEMIDKHNKQKPMFLYLSLQAVHGPLQVPNQYLKRFKHIRDKNRRIYAGMVYAMDRGIRQLVKHLKRARMWKNTIFIFSTDNGGQTTRGGNNWPLRGKKGTLWEGGIRGVGFVHGKPLQVTTPRVNKELLHVSDWYPTIMSATHCPYVVGTPPIDGYDQWETLRSNKTSKRTEILHNIDPLHKKLTESEFREGFDVSVRAAIRSGDWKLLTGYAGMNEWVVPPECTHGNITIGQIRDDFHVYPNSTKNVRLFKITEDPHEEREVSDQYPEVVNLLLARLKEYNTSSLPVDYPHNDKKSDPKRHGGFWLPWRGVGRKYKRKKFRPHRARKPKLFRRKMKFKKLQKLNQVWLQ
nr:arylsulfatase B-like [Ciona intestinalis]|eukprot:XP_002125106.3 arylsulfatase B-like [Ciona intestinalis]